MERITVEEAKQYIALKDDFTNKTVQDCPYFTLTPSKKGDGWEDVTYYTGRRVDMYANRDKNYDSWVSQPDRDWETRTILHSFISKVVF